MSFELHIGYPDEYVPRFIWEGNREVQSSGPEELARLDVLKSEAARQGRILGAVADVDRAARIELMPVNRENTQSGHRLAAPADRRTGGVNTSQHVHRHAELRNHPRVNFGGRFHGHRRRADLRTPANRDEHVAVAYVPPQNLAGFGRDVEIFRRQRRSMACAAAAQDAVGPDDHCPVGPRWIGPPDKRHVFDSRESLDQLRQFELALVSEDHAWRERAGIARRCLSHLLGLEQPSVLRHHPSGRVRQRVVDTRVEPQPANAESEPARCVENRRPRLACDVGVVRRPSGNDHRRRLHRAVSRGRPACRRFRRG